MTSVFELAWSPVELSISFDALVTRRPFRVDDEINDSNRIWPRCTRVRITVSSICNSIRAICSDSPWSAHRSWSATGSTIRPVLLVSSCFVFLCHKTWVLLFSIYLKTKSAKLFFGKTVHSNKSVQVCLG